MIDESQIEYLLNGERADADTLNRPLRQIVSAVNASVGAGSGLFNHAQLLGRNDDNAHPISAITGLQEALSGVRIKQQYESNPDTNAFTDDEKAKLTGIATGATKNRDDSENADKVHTHTWSEVTDKPAQATRWPTFDEVTGKPSTFAPSSHNHTSLTGTVSFSGSSGNAFYNSNIMVNGNGTANTLKPSIGFHQPGLYAGTLTQLDGNTFQFQTQQGTPAILANTSTPAAHTHPWSQVTGQPDTATRWPTWSEVTDKPTTYAPNRSTNTVDGGIKTRLSGTTLYMTNNGNDA